jgi:hypothetical protein
MIAVIHCDVIGRNVLVGELDLVGVGDAGPGGSSLIYRCPCCGGLAELRPGARAAVHPAPLVAVG